jgi:hypothetical protein
MNKNPTRSAVRDADHSVPGGLGGIVRARYACSATAVVAGADAITVPGTGVVFMIPLTVVSYDESLGQRFSYEGDGCVTIQQTGFYNVTLNLDWSTSVPGSVQVAYDVDLRKVLIKRVPLGVVPPLYTPGAVTQIPGGAPFDILGSHDIAGASAPTDRRAVFAADGFTLPAGTDSFVDVTLAAAAVPYGLGDAAEASHTTAPPEVLVVARVIGPNRVRLWTRNRAAYDVQVPAGQFRVRVTSLTNATGNSGNAWSYVNSGTLMLLQGEKVFVAVRSESPGDYLRVGDMTFLEITAQA